MRQMGMEIEPTADGVLARRSCALRGVDVTTQPFPGFPTDMQAQIMSLMCLSEGSGVISETIFENRFMHVQELVRMGADIRLSGQHFLSWIIVTGIIHDALSGTGIINELLVNLNVINQPINFFAHKEYFWPIVAFANVWKETGWNAIIYLAAITSIDPSLYEAASIDGAGRWAKIKHVTLPGIRPTIMILLLMNVGNVLNAGFEIQYLLGNGLVQSVSQTIDIYVLNWGISQGDFSIGTAAGIFKSVVSIILIVIANQLAKRNGDERLF